MDLKAMQAAVAKEVEVEQSAIKLIEMLSQGVKDLAKQPQGASQDQLKALADQLSKSNAALAAAVTANTPASSGSDSGGSASHQSSYGSQSSGSQPSKSGY